MIESTPNNRQYVIGCTIYVALDLGSKQAMSRRVQININTCPISKIKLNTKNLVIMHIRLIKAIILRLSC